MGVKQDLHNNVSVTQSIAAVSVGGGVTGSSIDLQNKESLDIQLNVGSGSGDGDYSVDIQESDDDSNWSSVSADDLEGSFTSNIDSGSDLLERVGYLGSKRYVRVVINENSTGTTAPIAAVNLVAGDLRYAGQAPIQTQT